jgi:type II secretory pathway component PulK
MKRKGVTSEVFKLALAIIIVAAILGLMAVFFSGVRDSGQVSINATTNALEDFSVKIANRTANF